jgi:histone acetyltransferase (RNA polymerase elongator complex component)
MADIYPIFIPFYGCKTRCIYCNQVLITKTTAPDLAKIKAGLSGFCNKNSAEGKEVAFYGGSFTLLPLHEQSRYLDLLKPFASQISGIRISTRPDGISPEILDFCHDKGIVTIELGIQSFSNRVLSDSGRSYTKDQAINSANSIKKRGFRLGIQLMPGLPGDNEHSRKKTVEYSIKLKPDFVRIYPTVVLKDTELAKLYKSGKYQPLGLDEAIMICADMVTKFSQHGIKVIKTGLHSGMSTDRETIVSGPYHESFGELVNIELYYHKIVNNYIKGCTTVISDKAISMLLGFNKLLLNRLKKSLSIFSIPIMVDSSLDRDEIMIVKDEPNQLL